MTSHLSRRLTALLFIISLSCIGDNSFNADTALLRQAVADTYGERAAGRIQLWRSLISELSTAPEADKLTQINGFFNQFYFINDDKLWGVQDYWATPVEFIGVNGGDCEDFSIAKYFALLELGIAPEKLRLVYVKALSLNQFHMVVAYYETPSSVPLLLDNINKAIKPATARADLQPIYSFNGSHLWLMKEKGRGQLAGRSLELKRWADLLSRFDLQTLQRPLVDLDS